MKGLKKGWEPKRVKMRMRGEKTIPKSVPRRTDVTQMGSKVPSGGWGGLPRVEGLIKRASRKRG